MAELSDSANFIDEDEAKDEELGKFGENQVPICAVAFVLTDIVLLTELILVGSLWQVFF